jgi:long-chain acyl-CoA synthetase
MTAPLASVDLSSGPRTDQNAGLRKDEPKTAVAIWKGRVSKTPDGVAFRFKRDGVWAAMTWAEADAAAREIAAGLVSQGVVPGDRIALAHLSPEHA